MRTWFVGLAFGLLLSLAASPALAADRCGTLNETTKVCAFTFWRTFFSIYTASQEIPVSSVYIRIQVGTDRYGPVYRELYKGYGTHKNEQGEERSFYYVLKIEKEQAELSTYSDWWSFTPISSEKFAIRETRETNGL